MKVPAGYERYDASGFAVTIGPVYRSTDGRMAFGVHADKAHTNTMGAVHGGLLLGLADSAIGAYVKSLVGPGVLALTTDLHASFMVGARVGEWIEAVPSVEHRGRTMVFASARLSADGRPVARVEATFYLHRQPKEQ